MDTTGDRHARPFPDVAAHVRASIDRSIDVAPFRELLTRLMAQPGRVLAVEGVPRWPAFVIETNRALGGDDAVAAAVAAAVEFAVAAADVVDDLVDDEWSLGVDERRRVNASLALSSLAQRCVHELVESAGPVRARRINELLLGGCLAACAGEDLDLVLETCGEVSEELAHEVTRRKSGSIVAVAFQVGAAAAVDDEDLLAKMGDFGCHVGLVAQLLNDMLDIAPDGRGSDLRRGKKTLPVAYLLRCVREDGLVLPFTAGDPARTPEEEEQRARLIGELGGLDYTWVVAEAHRREALALLPQMARLTGRKEVFRLRRLVPRMPRPLR